MLDDTREGAGLPRDRQMVRLVVIAGAVQAVFYLRNVLLLPLLSRHLGVELFGVWNRLQALSGLGTTLVSCGVIAGFARFAPSVSTEVRGRLFWTAVIWVLTATAALTGALLAGAEWVAQAVTTSSAVLVDRPLLAGVGAMAGAMALVQLSMGYFHSTARAGFYSLGMVLQVVGLAVAALVAIGVPGSGLWVPVGAMVVGPTLACVVLVGKAASEVAVALRIDGLRRMLAYGLPLLPMAGLQWTVDFADRYLLGWLAPGGGDAMVGLYSASYAMGGLVAMVFAPFYLFYTPVATARWDAGDFAEVARMTRIMSKCGAAVAVALTAAGFVHGGALTRLVAGAGFESDPLVVGTVMAAYCLYMLSGFAQLPLQMTRRTDQILWVSLGAAVVNVGACCALIPLPGPWGAARGAAVATLLSFAVHLSLSVVLGRRCRPLGTGWADIGIVACLGCCAAAVLWFGRDAGPLGVALSVTGAVLVYVGGLLMTRVFAARELRVVLVAVGWRRASPDHNGASLGPQVPTHR